MGKELKKVRKDLRTLKRSAPKLLKIALTSVLSEMVERIHEKGLNDRGGKIGSYSTKPISVSKRNQVRATGKSFFKGGYKEYRSSVGLDSNKVVLELTGQMRQDYNIIAISNTKAGLGFKNKLNGQKSEWMEEKYGTVYAPTKSENKTLEKVLEFESNRILK